jgi:hypothetical protein
MRRLFGIFIDLFQRGNKKSPIKKSKIMINYGIGGTEVPRDASEAISEIAQNRTLMVEKLTADSPVKPEIVEGLTSIEDVFNHFSPNIKMDFENSEGISREEIFSFKNLTDFGTKGITAQSEFLRDLTAHKEQLFKIIKQLRSNKLLRKTLENKETKEAMLNAIYALVKEIEEA